MKTALELIQESLDTVLFGPYEVDGESITAIPHVFKPGEGKLIVVAGENGAGKSLFRRVLSQMCRESDPEIEAMAISMQLRSEAPGFQRAMMFGDERYNATGYNSLNVISAGFTTCRDRSNPHALILDEPDLGLSDGAAAGAGLELCEFAQSAPEKTVIMAVTSHSRYLLQQLLPANPHFLCLGDISEPSLEDWINRPVVPMRLEQVKDRCFARSRVVRKVLDHRKKEKD